MSHRDSKMLPSVNSISSAFGDLCMTPSLRSTSSMSLNSSAFASEGLTSSNSGQNNQQLNQRCHGSISSSFDPSSPNNSSLDQVHHPFLPSSTPTTISSSIASGVTSGTNGVNVFTSPSREDVTFVTRTYSFKWNLIGYPFASSNVKSNEFTPTDTSDIWYLQMEPPRLRVEKGNSVDTNIPGSMPFSSVYSTETSPSNYHHHHSSSSSSSPPTSTSVSIQSTGVRFNSTPTGGYEYFTDCRLSLILKDQRSNSSIEHRASDHSGRSTSSTNSNINSTSVGFEISIFSPLNPSASLHTWVAFAESFIPYSDYPSKIFSFRGKITDLVTVHRLTSMTINCQLFYKCDHAPVPRGLIRSSVSCLDIREIDEREFANSSRSFSSKNCEEKHSLTYDLIQFFTESRKVATDVTFIAVDGAIEAHKVLLIARSVVFRDAFENETDIRTTGQIKMYGVNLKVLRPFVNFLYTDSVRSEDLFDVSFELLLLADKYKVYKLKNLCEITISRAINDDNFNSVVNLCRTVKSSLLQRKLMEFKGNY